MLTLQIVNADLRQEKDFIFYKKNRTKRALQLIILLCVFGKKNHSFGAVTCTQFFVNVFRVLFHGFDGYRGVGRDLLV